MNLETIWLVTYGGDAQASAATVVSWHRTKSLAEIGRYRPKAKKLTAQGIKLAVERASDLVDAGGTVTICRVTYTRTQAPTVGQIDNSAAAHYFAQVRLTCCNCQRQAHMTRFELDSNGDKWTCYGCGRINYPPPTP